MSQQFVKTFEDAEDHEIFDINDFTTASDWERFIVQIEELINQLKLNANSNTSDESELTFENGEWKEIAETIQFIDDVSFTFTYYSLCPKEHHHASPPKAKSKSQTQNKTDVRHSSSSDFDSIQINKSRGEQHGLAMIDNLNDESSAFKKLVNLPPKSMADLLNITNDFKHYEKIPSLAYYYGLTRFAVISPTRSSNFIDNESRVNIILSSISIAINNTGCTIPIFAQMKQIQRDKYEGLCEGSALKTHFQIVDFNYVPSQYAHLPGLLEVYKSKLGNHLADSSLLISVSIKFTYLIYQNTFLDWQAAEELNRSIQFDQDNYTQIQVEKLPFGSVQDCIDSICLSCSWCNLSEDIVVESDLSPQQSNDWSLIVDNVMDKCDYKLTTLLSKYHDQLRKTIGINQLLNLKTSESNEFGQTARASLRKLMQPKSKVQQLDQLVSMSSNVMNKVTLRIPRMPSVDDFTLPLDKQMLDYLMDYLFPDANLINQSSKAKRKETETGVESVFASSLVKNLNLIKASSSNGNGLLNRLAECMAILIQSRQLKAMAQLWREFLLELRFRFDNAIFINGLEDVEEVISSMSDCMPNLSRCLLHQKVQMLNCCIRKRVERDSHLQQQQRTDNMWNTNDSFEKEEEEDEFFDCDEEDSSAEGRLKRFNDFTLIQRPTEPLYVPVTQESAPMTEDMLDQHASLLLDLGSTNDAALLRAKIQSASLLSDMESFKAANPGCILEDFIRWYSPRDLIQIEEPIDPIIKEENEEKDQDGSDQKRNVKFELSARMKMPGNIWMDAWSQAKPVAARRQRRLFDDTKEAEKIFEWLNSLTVCQVIEQTMPIIFHSAILKCMKESTQMDINEFTEPLFEILVDKFIKMTRNNDVKKYQELVSFIKPIEQLVSLMKSLHSKFFWNTSLIKENYVNEINSFLKEILKMASSHLVSEVKIDNGANSLIGRLLTKLCHSTAKPISSRRHQSEFERSAESDDDENEKATMHGMGPIEMPFKREYILRSSTYRPAPYSRQSPQRMYCLLRENEFRLAGAFTEDTMFF